MLIFTTFNCVYNCKSNLLKNNFSNGLCCWYYFLFVASVWFNKLDKENFQKSSNLTPLNSVLLIYNFDISSRKKM